QRISRGIHYVGELGEDQAGRRLFEGRGLASELACWDLDPDAYEPLRVGRFALVVPARRQRHTQPPRARFPHAGSSIETYFGILDDMAHAVHRADPRFTALSTLREMVRAPSLARWSGRTLKDLLDRTVGDDTLAAVLAARCGNHALA